MNRIVPISQRIEAPCNELSWLLPLHAYALVDEGFQFHCMRVAAYAYVLLDAPASLPSMLEDTQEE